MFISSDLCHKKKLLESLDYSLGLFSNFSFTEDWKKNREKKNTLHIKKKQTNKQQQYENQDSYVFKIRM